MNDRCPALGELVAALWAIGPGSHQKLPDEGGYVDRALANIQDKLPSSLSEALTFNVGGLGLRCLEWQGAVLFMLDSLMAESDGNTFCGVHIRLLPEEAHQLLYGLGLMSAERIELAQRFYDAVQLELQTLAR